MGRSSAITIDTTKLKKFRDAKGLTQEEMGKKIAQKLRIEQKGDSARSSYKRIESKGKTSYKRLCIIAGILEIQPESLVGTIPEKTLSNMEKLVQKYLESEPKTELKRKYKEQPEGEKNIRAIAYELYQSLEEAKWSYIPEKIDNLSEYSGIPKEELLNLSTFRWRWFANISKYGMISHGYELR